MSREGSFFDSLSGTLKGASWLLMTPGFALIVLGALVWVVPKLLETIVALALIGVGSLFVVIAWHTRRIGQGYSQWSQPFSDVDDDIRDGTPR